jgi:NADH-quinone oxidoreductase subunit J
MTLSSVLFYFFATIAVAAGVLMVTRKNPVHAVLFLVLNFAGVAGVYLVLNAQFIAVVQIIVYAGAIMVLFLFVIMLLKLGGEESVFARQPFVKTLSIVIAALIGAQLTYVFFFAAPDQGTMVDMATGVYPGTVKAIAETLYTKYLLPFEAVGFTLVAATVGALVIGKKKLED